MRGSFCLCVVFVLCVVINQFLDSNKVGRDRDLVQLTIFSGSRAVLRKTQQYNLSYT